MVVRVLRIHSPLRRIASHVLPNPVPFLITADDVLVVVALPKRLTRRTSIKVDPLGGYSLERPNQSAQRFAFGRGDSRIALTRVGCNDDDAVQVVGHDNVRVQFHVRVPHCQPLPRVHNQLPGVVQSHFAVDYIAEQGPAFVGHDSNVVGAILGVVVPLQADRPTVMEIRIVSAVQRCISRRGGSRTAPTLASASVGVVIAYDSFLV